MAIGLTILVFLVVLSLFGLLHRVYDRMRLSDSQALLFILLIMIGSLINLTLVKGVREITLNIGGAVLPTILAFYVIGKADTSAEKIRGVVTIFITGGVLYLITKLMANFGHGRDMIDPLYVYGIIGGVIAYLTSRSRRLAFISATCGVLLLDIIHIFELYIGKVPGQVMIGGAGAFDAIIISGLIATILAEIIGESRERLSGGPEQGDELPEDVTEHRQGGEE